MSDCELPPLYTHLDNLIASQKSSTLYKHLQTLLHRNGLAHNYAIYFGSGAQLETAQATAAVSQEAEIALRQGCDAPTLIGDDTTLYPLSFQGDRYGTLALWPTNGPTKTLSMVAQNLGTALINVQLYEEARQHATSASAKIDQVNVIAELLKNLPLDVLLAKLMEVSLSIMKAEVGSIVLYRDGILQSEVEWGLSGEFLLNLHRTGADDTPYVESVINDGTPVFMSDVTEHGLDLSSRTEQLKSLICVPLQTNTEKLGALSIANTEGELDKEDYEVLTTISRLCSGSIENSLLQQSALTAQRMQEQMTIAADIQERLQAHSSPEVPGLEIDGWCIPCDETGGDYFDYLTPANGEVGVIVGDATGHGLPAALMMVGVRSSLLTVLNTSADLCDAFAKVNARAHRDSDQGTFMTLLAGFFSADRHTLHYCSAGHDLPLWFRSEEGAFISFSEEIDIPIGVKASREYKLRTLTDITGGDILIFGTDGLWEAFNEDNVAFDMEGLKKTITENADLPASFLSTAIRNAVLSHIGNAPRTDDITLVVVRVL